MSEINGYTLLAVSLIIIGTVVYAMVASAWHVMHDDGELRLQHMLKRNHATLDLATGGFGSYQAAVAVRRCVACPDKAGCDAWLASSRAEGTPPFCPNADFVQRAARKTPHRLI